MRLSRHRGCPPAARKGPEGRAASRWMHPRRVELSALAFWGVAQAIFENSSQRTRQFVQNISAMQRIFCGGVLATSPRLSAGRNNCSRHFSGIFLLLMTVT
jgi:hypothetical protein